MLLALMLVKAVQGSPVPAISVGPPPIAAFSQGPYPNDVGQWRTAWDIVRSCFITILSCTWVSLHANIPAPGEKWKKVKFRRLGLTIIALLAPELVVSWALRQRALACRLEKIHQGEFFKVIIRFVVLSYYE
jgi:hypothetical protein